MRNLLDDIEEDITGLVDLSLARLVDFHICSPFTVVLLNDGSVGSAGNYAVQNGELGYDPVLLKQHYLNRSITDPLLLDTLREEQSLAGTSLKTAILSALSQRLLNDQTLAQFGLICRPVDNWQEAITSRVQPHDRVTLIGFGGGLDVLCTLPDVDHLYVCDLMFAETVYQSMARDHIAQLCVDPDKVQLGSQVTATQMARSEICCITGSAICNGTLDELLALAQGCREIILQGPSCSVFPIALFRRSVTVLLTTSKTRAEYEAGQTASDDIYRLVDNNYIVIESRYSNGIV